MTLKAVTYYEIHCDEDGCDAQPDDDYSGWKDEDFAEMSAREADWSWDGQGKHWCPTHWPTCAPGEHIREDPEDRCTRCRQWPEDDDPAPPDTTQETKP